MLGQKKVIGLAVVLAGLFFSSEVLADAWWGEGYRSPQWVVANGGAILYYKSDHKKGDVVVDLYTSSGAVIETERGSRGIFDDALAGHSYYLKAKDRKEKFKSQVFTLRRNSTNYVTLDFKKEKSHFSFGASTGILGVQKVAPKPKPKVKIEEEIITQDPEKVPLTEEEKRKIEEDQRIGKKIEEFEVARGAVPEHLAMVEKRQELTLEYEARKNSIEARKEKKRKLDSISVLAIIFTLGGILLFARRSETESSNKERYKEIETSKKKAKK